MNEPLRFAHYEPARLAANPPPRILRAVKQLDYNPSTKTIVMAMKPENDSQYYHLFHESARVLRHGDEYSPVYKCLFHRRERRCSLILSKFSTAALDLDLDDLKSPAETLREDTPSAKRARIDQSEPGIGSRCTNLLINRLT